MTVPGLNGQPQIPIPQPAVVQPMPVPITYEVGQAQDGAGNRFVVLVQHTPCGTVATFYPPDHARRLAEQLTKNSFGIALAGGMG